MIITIAHVNILLDASKRTGGLDLNGFDQLWQSNVIQLLHKGFLQPRQSPNSVLVEISLAGKKLVDDILLHANEKGN